jgi:CHASE1-domain containing sensor protein
MSASDLVDQLFNIFDQRVDEAGSLIRGVAELFDEPEKRQAVLNAWNESRNEVSSNPFFLPRQRIL